MCDNNSLYQSAFEKDLNKEALIMLYSVTFAPELEKDTQAVMPISLSNPSFNEESIPAMLKAAIDSGAQVTVLIADYLSRHNMPESEALVKGDAIIKQYAKDFNHPAITVVRWKDWIEQRQAQFDLSLKQTKEAYEKGGEFKKAVLRTAKQCKSTMSKASSINYQLEEYAALGCKQEYDYLLYPAYISHGMFGFYKEFDVKKPTYVHVRLKKQKPNKVPQNLFFKNAATKTKRRKNAEYFSPYARSVAEQFENFLYCPEVAPNEKKVLADIMNRLATLYLADGHRHSSSPSQNLSGENLPSVEVNEKVTKWP